MTRLLLIALLLIASPAWATTKFIESGTDATRGTEHFSGVGNAPTSDCTISATGGCSVQYNNAGGGIQVATYRIITGYTPTNGRMSVRVNFTNLPTSGDAKIFVLYTAAFTQIYEIYVSSAGVLKVKANGTQVGSSGSTLATGTWYQLSLAWTVTSTSVNQVRLFLNTTTTPDITASNSTLAAVPNSDGPLYWGWLSGAGTSRIVNMDDFYWDDSSALTYPGDIRVTAKLPIANNVNTFDTAVGANPSTRYTNVNERPLSVTNGWEQAATSQATENYTVQSWTIGDVNLTNKAILAREAWVYAKSAGGTIAATITDNGSDSAITITTTATTYFHVTDSPLYPSNVAGVGMKSTGTTNDTFLYECGVLIAYIPATPGQLTQPRTVVPGVRSLRSESQQILLAEDGLTALLSEGSARAYATTSRSPRL